LQAKGRTFSLAALLGGDMERARPFREAPFATLYLSPRDYHRIHMPLTGQLREMVHVPGKLFSVSPLTARMVPELFARNERVAALFDTRAGTDGGGVGGGDQRGVDRNGLGRRDHAAAGHHDPPLELSVERRGRGAARPGRGDGALQHGLDRDLAVRRGTRCAGKPP
jgi:hypothetical protein